ncbi:hypothetical protein ACTXJU_08875 [Glutamicibacter ardleyensis]|uniref:hypothetical protein n=1 Tax=Glutamicibacter ardleyensis TaxID=225894 RepID=UPI003FD6570D
MKNSENIRVVQKGQLTLRTQGRAVTVTAVGEIVGLSQSTINRSAEIRELIQTERVGTVPLRGRVPFFDFQTQLEVLAVRAGIMRKCCVMSKTVPRSTSNREN